MLKYLPLILLSACGAAWAEAPAAVEPVAQHAFPVAGEGLLQLSEAFHALCPKARETSSACAHAADVLNTLIDGYNAANDKVIDAQ